MKTPFHRDPKTDLLAAIPMATITDPALNAAVTTVIIDSYSGVIITLTAAGNAQTLQSPTDVTAGKRFTLVADDSNGAHVIEVNGITMSAGEAQRFIWDGSAWIAVTAVDADDIAFTPVGDIVATDVQAAIEEVDTEKMKRITSVDNEIARFDGIGGDVQGYSSNAPIVSDDGKIQALGGIKAPVSGVAIYNNSDTLINLTVADLNKTWIIDNANNVVINLPSVDASHIDYWIKIRKMGTGNITINRADADTILDGTSVTNTNSAQTFAFLKLILETETSWGFDANFGSWSTS